MRLNRRASVVTASTSAANTLRKKEHDTVSERGMERERSFRGRAQTVRTGGT
jgi:hypothetical protein